MTALATIDSLSDEIKRDIDHWIAKYPEDKKQSAVMAALMIVQEANKGWLTTKLMDEIASYLEMPKIAVYEVATFYSMYELKPVGRHKVCICTNISCMLRGSDELVDHCKKKLGIGFGQTTKDGKVTLKEVECLAACRNAPAIQIGKHYYEDLTVEKLDKILDELE